MPARRHTHTTRIATKALADGDWVEVDATNGTVRKNRDTKEAGKRNLSRG
ncbi:MAG: hypothetical protein V1708_00875 [Candidatus Micrarchaeota archaeon]